MRAPKFPSNLFKPKISEPMKTVFLFRRWVSDTEIVSSLHCEGVTFYTIERAWKNNRSNISCIPSGKYTCTYLNRSASGKYKKVWHVRDVKNRFGVLIHTGNYASHSRGCIIIGKEKGSSGSIKAVWQSRSGLREFNKLMGKQDFILNIIGDQNV